jgi:lipopolysaccharide transport system ATP-binding protein
MVPAVKIENLSKQYRLGLVGTGTLSHDLKRWWHSIRGLEDPFLMIGETNDRRIKGSSEYIWALKDINFEVKKGEVLGIIGQNGAGKSTLLKILSKVTAPTTGSITYAGRISSLLEVGTGFNYELTGRENIYLNGAILGMRKKEIENKFDEIVDFSGCERYIDTPVKRYSSGMTVRLGFAVAAFLEPEILVVDEVLAVGDAEFHKKAIEKMKSISTSEGRTILFVSHNMSAVKHLCQKAVSLKNGLLDKIGGVDEIIDDYLAYNKVKDKARTEIVSDDGRFSLKAPYWLTDKNESTNLYLLNDAIKLRFEFDFYEEVKQINPGIAIVRLDGQRIFTSHLLDDPNYKKPKSYKGKMTIDTEFDLTSIAPGIYSVIFGVRDENEKTVIYSENELQLEIGHIQFKNAGYGILWHTTKWEIK